MNHHLSLSLDSTQPETEKVAPARVKRAQERLSSCSSRRQKGLLILRENKGNTPTFFCSLLSQSPGNSKGVMAATAGPSSA